MNKKISLSNIKDRMSRHEMKNIMAGSGGAWQYAYYKCCWRGTNNCSNCVTGSASGGGCTSGADAVAC